MTEDTTLTSQTWLVAIDIGKAFHAVLVEGIDGKRQQFRMANHLEDYDRLIVFLRGLSAVRAGPARARTLCLLWAAGSFSDAEDR